MLAAQLQGGLATSASRLPASQRDV